jgi:hypothetical protein
VCVAFLYSVCVAFVFSMRLCSIGGIYVVQGELFTVGIFTVGICIQCAFAWAFSYSGRFYSGCICMSEGASMYYSGCCLFLCGHLS